MAKRKPPLQWFRDPLVWLCITPLAFVFLYCLGSIIGFGNLRAVKGEVWAAWVQAVGSIAAIVGAIWIASRQSNAAMIQGRQQTSQRLDAIARLVQIAADSAMTAFNDRHPHPKNGERPIEGDAYAAFDEATEAIRAISLDVLPSDVAVLEAFEVKHALTEIHPLMKEMNRASLGTVDWNAFLRIRRRLDLSASNFRGLAEMALAGRGNVHLAAVTLEQRNQGMARELP